MRGIVFQQVTHFYVPADDHGVSLAETDIQLVGDTGQAGAEQEEAFEPEAVCQGDRDEFTGQFGGADNAGAGPDGQDATEDDITNWTEGSEEGTEGEIVEGDDMTVSP